MAARQDYGREENKYNEPIQEQDENEEPERTLEDYIDILTEHQKK